MHAPLLQQVPDRKAIEAASQQIASTDLHCFQDHPGFLISPTALKPSPDPVRYSADLG